MLFFVELVFEPFFALSLNHDGMADGQMRQEVHDVAMVGMGLVA